MSRLQIAAVSLILAVGWVVIAVSAPAGATPAIGEYTPPVLNCGEGTVPGWLNEYGDPTSCVGDNPCPEVDLGEVCPADVVVDGPDPIREVDAPVIVAPPVEVVLVVPSVDRLAETGRTGIMPLAGLSGLLLTGGVGLLVRAIRRTA